MVAKAAHGEHAFEGWATTPTLPRTIYGYVWCGSGPHQVFLCVLSVVVFLISTLLLELQRRIVNDVKGPISG